MKKITMEEYLDKLHIAEMNMNEEESVANLFRTRADALRNIQKDNIVIRTDYDADGITSAYIMQKALHELYPNKTIDVRVNDRRGAYAALPDDKDDSVCYIILDMGSNAIDEIEAKYGDCFVIDHHLPNDEEMKKRFLASGGTINGRWLNFHIQAPGVAPDYCTAGLAYRLFLELYQGTDEKLRNTVAAMAAIGTIADSVDLMDPHGLNRQIVKQGMAAINDATKDNFDAQLGYLIANLCPALDGNIGAGITANDIRMKIAPFINGAGRMASVWGKNGSQEIYDALCEENNLTIRSIEYLLDIKKEVMNQAQSTDRYLATIAEGRKKSGLQVYYAEGIEHNFCGLLAAKLCEATDLPWIVLTYNEKKGEYSGSARNCGGYPSIKDFLDKALEGRSVDIVYGGHDDAIGISRLQKKSISGFMRAIEEGNKTYKPVPEKDEVTVVDLSLADLKNKKSEVLQFLYDIDPIPKTCLIELPYDSVSATSNKGSCRCWKNVTLVNGKAKTKVTDWAYDAEKYSEKTPLLAAITVDTYQCTQKQKDTGEPNGLGSIQVGVQVVYKHSYEMEKLKAKGKTKGDEVSAP